jgi:SAM-dependent methyltransferase
MPDERTEERLEEQRSYYRARAGEYDDWWLRRGRYDRGPDHNRRWHAEAEKLLEALRAFGPKGRVLELACGTGLWTEQLVQFAKRVTAVDASPEMLSIARERVSGPAVRYVEADIFSWHSDALYDVVFFSFWLSHVPPDRFAPFWDTVRSCLAPGGRVFFLDSLYSETSTAQDHRLGEPTAVTARRRLNDGREFEIFKVFYGPGELARRLAELGWAATVCQTETYFLYGSGTPRQRRDVRPNRAGRLPARVEE